MKCYRKGGCGLYEMLPCNECPPSKPEYLNNSKKNWANKKNLKIDFSKKI